MCPNCGKPTLEGASFCSACGCGLSSSSLPLWRVLGALCMGALAASLATVAVAVGALGTLLAPCFGGQAGAQAWAGNLTAILVVMLLGSVLCFMGMVRMLKS